MNTLSYNKNNNILNTNYNIFYMNILSYNKNNYIYNTNNYIFEMNILNYKKNNYIKKPKIQEPWVLIKDARGLGPDAEPTRPGSGRRTQAKWVLI